MHLHTPMIEMKKIIITLSVLLWATFSMVANVTGSSVVQDRNIQVAFSFSQSNEMQEKLSSYVLNQNGSEVCRVDKSDVSSTGTSSYLFDCRLITEDGNYEFTLSAAYSDGSVSQVSDPFPYTVGSGSSEVPSGGGTGGSKTIIYKWEATDSSHIAGYRMYMNEMLLCETDSVTNNSLSCTADLISGPMVFSVASYDNDGIESGKSNILLFDPANFPELFVKKKVSFEYDHKNDTSINNGFRVYHNSKFLCDTDDPSIRKIYCEVELVKGDNSFSVRAIGSDGSESLSSNIIVYNYGNTSSGGEGASPSEGQLTAKFIASPSSGVAPFDVEFDASGSTGDIASYSWDFGNTDSSSGEISHYTYTASGDYTATLTVTDVDGNSQVQQVDIIVRSAADSTEPPSAVIGSTPTAVGNAPLELVFDGTKSETLAPPLTYIWSFGDGDEAVGETVTHTYIMAGDYNAVLTVIDANGLEDTVDTPVLVNPSDSGDNVAPQARIVATPSDGNCPLTVNFDGSGSNDSDGSIANYTWQFEDGSIASGSTVQKTFATAATHIVSLVVTDDLGTSSQSVAQQITCTETPPEVGLSIQVGELDLTHEWVSVEYDREFIRPVVIAGPPTVNDFGPAFVQLRNITAQGFDIRLREWSYQDGLHKVEQVSYLVIEQGRHQLEGGAVVEAGYFDATSSTVPVTFQQPFSTVPIVLTTVSSDNDSSPASGRIHDITNGQFGYLLQEEERSDSIHPIENVGYIAWETGSGSEGGVIYEAARTTDSITHLWKQIEMKSDFVSLPFFFANMQTLDGSDPATIRQRYLSAEGVKVLVQEEKSKNKETKHTTEVVGYLVIGSQEP